MSFFSKKTVENKALKFEEKAAPEPKPELAQQSGQTVLQPADDVIALMAKFPVGKVVNAFRDAGWRGWDYGRIMGIEYHSQTREPLGLVVQFFSDKGTVEYPFAVLNLGEESFVLDAAAEDVIRSAWPVGAMVMANMVGKGWVIAKVIGYTFSGVRLEMDGGTTTFAWGDFSDDGRCSELMRVDQRRLK